MEGNKCLIYISILIFLSEFLKNATSLNFKSFWFRFIWKKCKKFCMPSNFISRFFVHVLEYVMFRCYLGLKQIKQSITAKSGRLFVRHGHQTFAGQYPVRNRIWIFMEVNNFPFVCGKDLLQIRTIKRICTQVIWNLC